MTTEPLEMPPKCFVKNQQIKYMKCKINKNLVNSY